MVKLLRNYIERMTFNISPKHLFPKVPTIRFEPIDTTCLCGKKRVVLKTHTKTVATLEIGEFKARETRLVCHSCQLTYCSNELIKLVPSHSKFGFDVLLYIGKALFIQGCNEKEIQHELNERNINISIREIGYLGKKFIVYLALCHQECQDKLRQLISSQGGYVLHLDGTCEKDSPHLMSALDELTQIVLNNIKLPSENSVQIIPFRKLIKKSYGKPIALVHDMGKGILKAISEVFPFTPDFICHENDLRDIGNVIEGNENTKLRQALTTYKIRSILRDTLKKLKKIIDENAELSSCLKTYLKNKHLDKPHTLLKPIITTYLIIVWVLEARCELGGFGFPFDRLHLVFYQRLKMAYPTLNNLKEEEMLANSLSQLIHLLNEIINDKILQQIVQKMSEKVKIFDQLRKAMRIALPEQKKGLNDDGDEHTPIPTIKERVIQFRRSEKIKQLASTEVAYQKMLKQIDQYWEKLFADPIQVVTKLGTITIQPQRTNNIMERLFRDVKRTERKKSGNFSLSKTLKAMIADTPLVKNIENQQYLEIVLNGKNSLEERFAEIDIKLVRQELNEKQKLLPNISPEIKNLHSSHPS